MMVLDENEARFRLADDGGTGGREKLFCEWCSHVSFKLLFVVLRGAELLIFH